MSFTKKELTGKSLSELKAIAEELGISADQMDETQLMYEIIDQSAIQSASQKNEKVARKRTKSRLLLRAEAQQKHQQANAA